MWKYLQVSGASALGFIVKAYGKQEAAGLAVSGKQLEANGNGKQRETSNHCSY